MERSFVGWNSLRAAIPWFRNGAYLGKKKMWSETRMDLREYQLNVGLIGTASRFSPRSNRPNAVGIIESKNNPPARAGGFS